MGQYDPKHAGVSSFYDITVTRYNCVHLLASIIVNGQRSLRLTTVLYCDCNKQWNCSVSAKYQLHGAKSFQKLTVPRLAKRFLFYGTRSSITVFRRTRYLSASWGKLIQPMLSHPVFKIQVNIIRPSTPRCSTQLKKHKPKNVTFNSKCLASGGGGDGNGMRM
jgi:hypothetical protein